MPMSPVSRRVLSKAELSKHLSSSSTTVYADTSRSSSHGFAAAIRCIAWAPLGTFIATASSSTIRIWNPDKPSIRSSIELRLAGPQAGRAGAAEISFNPVKEAELASVGVDGVVRFWDIRATGGARAGAGFCVGEVKLGGDGISIAWKPDGKELVVGRKDDTLVVVSRTELAQIGAFPQSVQTNRIAFSHAGTELLLSTGDSRVCVVDYPSMGLLHSLHAHTSACFAVALCPRGRFIATGGTDALICLYDTSEYICRRTLSEMTGPVRNVSFTWDGSYVVGGSDEGNGILVSYVESGDTVYTIPTTHPATCVAWHPNKYALAYTSDVAGLKIVGYSSTT